MGSSFNLTFEFEDDDDGSKAMRLHSALKGFGALSSIVLKSKRSTKNKNNRQKNLLDIMDYDSEYTTGKLWALYHRHNAGSYKTYTRDLQNLVIQGIITGRKELNETSKGCTVKWSRTKIESYNDAEVKT